jgi:hypothetical protein
VRYPRRRRVERLVLLTLGQGVVRVDALLLPGLQLAFAFLAGLLVVARLRGDVVPDPADHEIPARVDHGGIVAAARGFLLRDDLLVGRLAHALDGVERLLPRLADAFGRGFVRGADLLLRVRGFLLERGPALFDHAVELLAADVRGGGDLAQVRPHALADLPLERGLAEIGVVLADLGRWIDETPKLTHDVRRGRVHRRQETRHDCGHRCRHTLG